MVDSVTDVNDDYTDVENTVLKLCVMHFNEGHHDSTQVQIRLATYHANQSYYSDYFNYIILCFVLENGK